MRSNRLITMACLVGLALCASLGAQAGADEEAAVIAAAVNHMTGLLRSSDGVPAGTIKFDERIVQSRRMDSPAHSSPVTVYELTGTRSAEVAVAARTMMGAEPGQFDAARVCASESLRSCNLGNAVAVFASSDPLLGGDTAQVVVKAMWMGDLAKQPVQDGIFLLSLQRDSSQGWRVVATRTLRIS
ncbi:hypothetical protein [Longimicrobium sp.]|uniref:hypothetical protein n=1 Tax=Longimicrobium sp. TaxID=2029185 RepID=UPI003B3A9BCE